jgi:uncharacterized repeat protein (TIGR01451 family)
VDAVLSTVDFAAVGDAILYTITVRNTGNVVLAAPQLTDPSAALLGCSPSLPLATLPSGASIVCTASHTATQADLDAGRVVNIAHASASAPDSTTVTADSPEVVTPARQHPGLVLAKLATLADRNGNAVGNPGEDIAYVLTARNDGNVTLRGVAVSDPMFPNLTCERQQPTDLAPGESYRCQGTHTIAAADVVNGTVVNTATASGASECSPGVVCEATVSDHAEAKIDAIPGSLPRTGIDTWRELRIATSLLLIGLFLLQRPIRRRREAEGTAT